MSPAPKNIIRFSGMVIIDGGTKSLIIKKLEDVRKEEFEELVEGGED